MSAVQCKRCGVKVASSEVRFLSPTEYACEQCYLASKGQPRKEVSSKPKGFDASPVKRVTMVCSKCSFPNKVKPEDVASRTCSYCGGTDFKKQTSSAATILEESDTSQQ